MRDLANKMAELKFVAPLAQFEDEWSTGTGVDYQNQFNNNHNNNTTSHNANNKTINNINNNNGHPNRKTDGMDNELTLLGDIMNEAVSSVNAGTMTPCDDESTDKIIATLGNVGSSEQNFGETISGSLEDLVNTFDEKITKCFGNFEQSVEELAPVQVRSQEEIMSECQMWWTITGNFGNILPIDWSKSCARQMHIPALKLGEGRPNANGDLATDDELNDLSSEDEAVANDLDMHALILGGMHAEAEPIKTAEEVMKEIDDIMDETQSDEDLVGGECEAIEKAKEVLGAMLYEDKLQQLSISQLNELYMEMETIIRELSETLISQLALRDECEYEKEMKNSFISLLLAVQNRRRQYHIEKKRGKTQGKQPSGMDPKYLTTVIPYHMDNGPPDNQALQVLIKILRAINEDSPTVPTLLTDYILKILCPT